MELVSKLSVNALGWDRNALGAATSEVPKNGGQVLLGRMAGIVTGLKQIVDKDTGSITTGLRGSFKGISSKSNADGVLIESRSAVCYLPNGIQDMVEASLEEARSKDRNAVVRFALDVYAIPSTNKAGYTFKANTVLEDGTADPVDALLASIPALPSPDKVAK